MLAFLIALSGSHSHTMIVSVSRGHLNVDVGVAQEKLFILTIESPNLRR